MNTIDRPFKHCPTCAAPDLQFLNYHEIRCAACGFRYFHNVAAAVGAVMIDDGRCLFVVRGHEPSKGQLGLPGGFVDPGESLEIALAREISEEIAGQIGPPRFLASFANQYQFADINYHTCDCYFSVPLLTPPPALRPAAGEIAQLRWLRPDEIDPAALGFSSLVALWEKTDGFRRVL
jgi:NAD+ diphosphatase